MVGNQSLFRMIAGVVLAMLVMAGCAGKEQERNAAAPPQPATAPTNGPTGGGAGGDARTVKHAMGTTEIKGTPQRVVTLFQGATDAALALGVKPVGAVESWIEQPWYVYIRDRMDGVANLGSENQPNLEQIIALKPDLIIGSKSRNEKIYSQLAAIAPTVMEDEVYFWKDTLQLSAEAMNKQTEESKFLADWNKKVADFKTKMGDKLKNTTVAVVDFRADHVRIVYTGFAALVLDELGVPRPDNQKGEDWGVKLTSTEGIPQMDADILFDQTSLDRTDGRMDLRKKWMANPLWSNLRAVKAGKVHEVDTAVWNNGSGPLAAMRMIDDLYNYFGLH